MHCKLLKDHWKVVKHLQKQGASTKKFGRRGKYDTSMLSRSRANRSCFSCSEERTLPYAEPILTFIFIYIYT